MALKADGKTVCPQPLGLTKVSDNCPTAYFNRSTPMGANATAFRYAGHRTTAPTAPFPWTPNRHAPPLPWPPHGLQLIVNFTNPAAAHVPHRAVVLSVHYELYDGAPVMTKWLSLHSTAPNGSSTTSESASSSPHPHTHHHHGHNHRLAVAADAAAVPPDQQGPVCLQPCHIKLPASGWESHWKALPADKDGSGSTPPAERLQLSGAMASRKLVRPLPIAH